MPLNSWSISVRFVDAYRQTDR